MAGETETRAARHADAPSQGAAAPSHAAVRDIRTHALEALETADSFPPDVQHLLCNRPAILLAMLSVADNKENMDTTFYRPLRSTTPYHARLLEAAARACAEDPNLFFALFHYISFFWAELWAKEVIGIAAVNSPDIVFEETEKLFEPYYSQALETVARALAERFPGAIVQEVEGNPSLQNQPWISDVMAIAERNLAEGAFIQMIATESNV